MCDTVVVTVYVGDCENINLPPDAVNDTVTVATNTTTTICPLTNDSDPNGDVITLTTFTNPANGTLVQDGNCLDYTPNPGFTGTDSFQYQICDADGLCDVATVFITVTPAACDDTQYLCADPTEPFEFCVDFCNLNGTVGTEITTTIATMNATVTQTSDTCLQYTPMAGFNGLDSLIVTGCNNAGICDTSIIYFLVGCAAPIAVDDEGNYA